MALSAGMDAPEFELQDENGTTHRLRDYRGKPVVLYFYPRDNTSGCTVEACNFRDDYSEYAESGVTILGVSPDTVKSHGKFKSKYNLNFPLLSDPDHQVSERYEAWGEKKAMGRTYQGILRTTYVIGPDGKIRKIFKNVKPAGHSREVLSALKNE